MRRKLRILYVAYPLLAVNEESCGGAEQVMLALEGEMRRRGHETWVAAPGGSRVGGKLIPTNQAARKADDLERCQAEHIAAVSTAIEDANHRGVPFDVVHDHSSLAWQRAFLSGPPWLVTLHLPRNFYSQQAFREPGGHLYFSCVSQAQAADFRDLPQMLAVVDNAVDTACFPLCREKSDYLLWLGRICEEKAPHHAVDVATMAGMPLVLAGSVYPFSYHQDYFDRELAPRLLGRPVEMHCALSRHEKIDLLARARALLITSTVAETSSLVAMEAMACGTLVIALRSGALPEIVGDGETGYLADSVEEAATAVRSLARIDSAACRKRVVEHFSLQRMADNYEQLYWHISTGRQRLAA
jgi:glycosyltransferase involved in cell wall biosynthesis